MQNALVLIGGGGHSLVVAETALAAGYQIAGFFDDNPDAPLAGGSPAATRLGSLTDTGQIGDRLWIVAMRDVPPSVVDGLNQEFAATVIHPSAVVSPSAAVSPGSLVAPNASVNARARIGRNCIINTGAVVEHECVVGDGAHIAPGAALAGRVRVGEDSTIGLGARVLPGVAIGRSCIVGAGAVVTSDLEEGTRVAGVPARPL